MQYKKDELKNTILQEAEREFFEKGYQNASLRQVAKRTGTTIGNLYHYFDSKEALFGELVREEHDAFLYMLENHSEVPEPFGLEIMDHPGELVKRVNAFVQQLLPVFSKKFLILMDYSAGTPFENTKEAFVDFLNQHFFEHVQTVKSCVPPEFVRFISLQFLSGIIHVIRYVEDESLKKQMLVDLILFNIAGISGISEWK